METQREVRGRGGGEGDYGEGDSGEGGVIVGEMRVIVWRVG